MIYFAERHLRLPHTFPVHSHVDHELLWDVRGRLVVRSRGEEHDIGPSLGLLVPAGVEHDAVAAGETTFRETYLEPDASQPLPWASPRLVTVTRAARATLDLLASMPSSAPGRGDIERAVVPMLVPVGRGGPYGRPPMPHDDRARRVAEAILRCPEDVRTLVEHGRDVGASARTLSRLFSAETGLSFARWRSSVRMSAATGLLAAGRPSGATAGEVGYRSASAFSRAYRSATGRSPGSASATESDGCRDAVTTHVLGPGGWSAR